MGCDANGIAGMTQMKKPKPVIESLESRQLLAAVLPRDVNLRTPDSNAQPIISANGNLFFTAAANALGNLWLTDGTPEGTRQINLDGRSVNPNRRSVAVVNNIMYFSAAADLADPDYNGAELWRTDGTAAGTYLVKDIYTGVSSSNPSYLTEMSGTLYFSAASSAGTELWKSDGTAGGTVMVRNFANHLNPKEITRVGSTLYFSGEGFDTGTTKGVELWKSDGTSAGTVIVKDIVSGTGSSTPTKLTALGATLVFSATESASGTELYQSSGASATTAIVQDINPGSGSSNPVDLTEISGTLFFSATNSSGSATYRYIGSGFAGAIANTAGRYFTPVGTDVYFFANNDIRKYPQNTGFSQLVTSDFSVNSLAALDGKLLLAGDKWADPDGSELWSYDATTFQRIEDIFPGNAASTPLNFFQLGAELYFSANDGAHGVELWRTDGSAPGTGLVFDVATAGTVGSDPANLVDLDGVAVFTATDSEHGRELWRSDGTADGTWLVKDIAPGSGDSSIGNLFVWNNVVYFEANDEAHGTELWRSDGTPAGTYLLKDADPSFSGRASSFAALGGWLYYLAGGEVWRTDGTANNTLPVTSTATHLLSSLQATSDTLFAATSNTLYKSPATPGALTLLRTFSSLNQLTAVGNTLFFAGTTSTSGTELWKSDGTVAGTMLVTEIRASNASSLPQSLIRVGDVLYFTAADASGRRQLWKSDGSDPGTALVKATTTGSDLVGPTLLTNVDGTLFFIAPDGVSRRVWKSDGTSDGTVPIGNFTSLSSGIFAERYGTAIGHHFYFYGSDGVSSGVWRTDGTVASSARVVEGGYATVSLLTAVGDDLFFAADDHEHGVELMYAAIPSITSTRFDYDATTPSVIVSFDEYVAGSLDSADVVIKNLNSGHTYLPGELVVNHDSATNQARIVLSSADPVLPDGNYMISFNATGITNALGNSLPRNVTASFFVFAGDANHDRRIDVADFKVFSANWMQTNRTFSQGDFNYDGNVDQADLAILSAKWNTTLPPYVEPVPIQSPAPKPSSSSSRRTKSVAASVLT
jgi:ELWxxDGT repeat protein